MSSEPLVGSTRAHRWENLVAFCEGPLPMYGLELCQVMLGSVGGDMFESAERQTNWRSGSC